jgi:TRAP-type uncharacterized transport system fused permease subunit
MIEIRKTFALFLCFIWLGFQLYIGLIRPLHPLLQNSVHLLMALLVIYAYFPSGKKWWQIIDLVISVSLILVIYHLLN